MNPFIAWLDQISATLSGPAAWAIFLAGAGIYLINAWRIRFLILIAQYFFVGILFARIFDTRPEMALLKILVGWLICGTFLISARVHANAIARAQAKRQSEALDSDARTNAQRPLLWASNLPFRILSLIVMTVVAYLASAKYPLPFISTDLALACFILIILAVLFIGTEENDVMIVGVGVLNLLAALDLFYSAQDPGLLVTGLLVMVNLLVGLAISYLAVVEVAE
ncbi:MAG: hypothetical protein JXR84_25290 [Anaerolineae bacterium]|nr:hypothetical protein [Anaerolineae bacterium]